MTAASPDLSPSTRPAATARLQRWLAVDATVTGVNAVAYLAASGPLEEVLGLSRTFILGVGTLLGAFTGLVAWTARRQRPLHGAVLVVVGINGAWATASVALAVLDPVGLTGVGRLWVVLQAIVVATFAILQGTVQRRESQPPIKADAR